MPDGLTSPAGADRDLVMIALPGVQRFISEARSTADARAASEIVARLAAAAAAECQAAGGELVFPSALAADTGDSPGGGDADSGDAARDGMPNRVVARAPAGAGPEMAGRAGAAVHAAWDSWLRQALPPASAARQPMTGARQTGTGLTTEQRDEALATPGFPVVQWVCVPAVPGEGYAAQWERAREALEARRRVRDFAAVTRHRTALCSLSPRWPAAPEPAGLKEHEKDTLSAANWVKRRWRRMRNLDGFASTASIASAGYRRYVAAHLDDPQVAAAVSELMSAARLVGDDRETPVPGLPALDARPGRWLVRSAGPWVYADRWQPEPLARETRRDVTELRPAAAQGAAAARRLAGLMDRKYGVPAPTTYLAVLVQDLDGMGMFLSGQAPGMDGNCIEVSPAAHEAVSAALRTLAARQRRKLEGTDLLGVPIYAGGDDLLAFLPAATALAAAQACHDLIPPSAADRQHVGAVLSLSRGPAVRPDQGTADAGPGQDGSAGQACSGGRLPAAVGGERGLGPALGGAGAARSCRTAPQRTARPGCSGCSQQATRIRCRPGWPPTWSGMLTS